MFFIFHYIMFNAGLSAIIILLTLFLQTYSAASLTEIGALLMILPFVSIIAKPLFCALADRHQAHKLYLAAALLLMSLGYGSLTLAPFYPDFVATHGRLVWYLDIVGIIVGFTAFGVIWSLGDALAVNAARLNNVPWGSYRVWGTVSWGVFGWLIGLVNETPALPKYVPALLVMSAFLFAEALLVFFWPYKRTFDMAAGDALPEPPPEPAVDTKPPAAKPEDSGSLSDWPMKGLPPSLSGTLSGSARLNPRLMGALAGELMGDLGGSIKSSLKLGGGGQRTGRRTALADILEQHKLCASPSTFVPDLEVGSKPPATTPTPTPPAATTAAAAPAPESASKGANQQLLLHQFEQPAPPPPSSGQQFQSLGRVALRRTQQILSRMNSLSSASGHAIAEQLRQEDWNGSQQPGDLSIASLAGSRQSNAKGLANGSTTTLSQPRKSSQVAMMSQSSFASNVSLSRAAAARALGFGPSIVSATGSPAKELAAMGLASGDSCACASSSESGSSASLAACCDMPSPMEPKEPKESAKEADERPQGQASGQQLARPSVEDLQLVLLKLIIRRDRDIFRYLLAFTSFGILFTIHDAYFFLHVEHVCRLEGFEFSRVTGAMIAAQSVSEIFSFLVIVPYFVPRVGRLGALLSSAIMFAARYAFYGLYFAKMGPYSALPFEVLHGFAYGIIYTLITEIAIECVNQVDHYVPELIKRRIIGPEMDPGQLKLPLRATMQGVFSGAFDGLGNGVGALFAGIYLDANPGYTKLWIICAWFSLALAILYPMAEMKSRWQLKREKSRHRKQQLAIDSETNKMAISDQQKKQIN